MKVIIEGFISEKHAQTFINWYSEQGEQDSDEWFDIQNQPTAYIDMKKTFPIRKDKDGNLIIVIHSQADEN